MSGAPFKIVLTPDHEDAFVEILNIGIGRAAAALSELIGQRIELSVVSVRVATGPGVEPSHSDDESIVIVQGFRGGASGRAALVFPHQGGRLVASLLAGLEGPEDELDVELQGILLEVGNIVLNGVLGSLANETGDAFDYAVPRLAVGNFREQGDAQSTVLVGSVNFSVSERDVSGSIVVVFELGSIDRILEAVGLPLAG